MAKSQLSPQRAALIDAIEAKQIRAREREPLEAALAAANEACRAAVDVSLDADEALRRGPGPETMVPVAIQRLRGWSENSPARQLLLDKVKAADDVLAECQADRALAEDHLKAFDDRDWIYAGRVKDAAVAVLRSECSDAVSQAVATAEAAMLTLLRARADLQCLVVQSAFGNSYADAPQNVRDVMHPFLDEQRNLAIAAEAASPWFKIIDRLIADPLLPLPSAKA